MGLKNIKTGMVLAACAAALLPGCSSIPERTLENAFHYQRLKRSEATTAAPIESEYQALASKAWKNREQGIDVQYVSLLEGGDDALLARIHLIRAAKGTIDLQTFIWRDDPTSRFIFDELVAASERGVLVRILIDALNMPASPEQLARMARAHRNLEICIFKPLSDNAARGKFGFWDQLLFKTRRMNRRMHNKLLLIDGRIGIAGGRNYEGKYFDRATGFLFRDRDIVVAGPAVLDMQDSFELFWQDKNAVFLTQLKDVEAEFRKTGNSAAPFLSEENRILFETINRLADDPAPSRLRKSLRIYAADEVWFVYDTPRKFNRGRERTNFDSWFKAVIEGAEDRIVYQTPYLIYNQNVRRAFNELHRKHPEMRIIASSNSLASADHIHVYAISFKHRKEIYKKSGIDIYEAKPYPADRENYVLNYAELARLNALQNGKDIPPTAEKIKSNGPRLCIHAKSFVIDGELALVGSHNFDPRSARLNTECGVFVADLEVAEELESRILNACEPGNAWTVSKAPHVPVVSYFSGFIGSISAALPFMDVWPYRYTTLYELKAGAEVLPPRDPRFQENYSDVGYFPEVSSSVTVIRTNLLKAFGGWARPLL